MGTPLLRWSLFPVLLISFVSICEAQGFAAMSIDFGSKFLKVGLVKPGVPLEIVLNKESRRKTPNLVYLGKDERAFGDAAAALQIRYPHLVYSMVNELVGKEMVHPLVKEYMQSGLPPVIAHPNRSTVAVEAHGNIYSIESLIAMTLSHARHFVEAFAEQTVKDVVISVPVFFNQAERTAIANAAKIAKLNLLQLINDGTAAGLNYGIFRRNQITEKPSRMLIYDMGASKTTATLVEYKLVKEKYSKEPQMAVLGVGYDRTLGGEVITVKLRELLIEKFRAAYKTEKDVTTSPKAMAKFYKEAERIKQVLSANTEHFAQIESAHEDVDMRIKVTRDELNELLTELLTRMVAPVYQAVVMADLTMDQIDQFVLMGAGTRVPKVQEMLQKAIGEKELGRFLNTDEAIAMGALYQAAELSKGFKVKPFRIQDIQIQPIQVNFISKQKNEETGEVTEKPIQRVIFPYKSFFPSSRKVISFTSYTEDFNFDLNYGDMSHLTEDQRNLLGSANISQISVAGLKKALEEKLTDDNVLKGVKAAFSVDGSGLLKLEGAEAILERKPKGVVENKESVGAFAAIANKISSYLSSDKKEEGEPVEEQNSEAKEETATENGNDEQEENKENTESAEKQKGEETQKETKNESESKESEGKEKENGKNKSDEEKEKTTTKKNETVPAVEKVKLNVSQLHRDATHMDVDERKASIAVLQAFEKAEKLRAERQAAENELESYAFEASLLREEQDFIEFSTEAEREAIAKETGRVRAWLEDDTDLSTPTDEFTTNLRKIKDLVTPVKKRLQDQTTRPAALTELEDLIKTTKTMIASSKLNLTEGTPKAMLDEVEAFEKKIERLEAWLTEKKAGQEKTAKHENPVLKTEDLTIKAASLKKAFVMHIKKMEKIATDIVKAQKKAEREKKKKEEAEKAKKEKEEKEGAETTEKKPADEKPESEEQKGKETPEAEKTEL